VFLHFMNNVVRKFRNKGTQFRAAFHEGSDAISQRPGLVGSIAEIAGTLLVLMNALVGLAWLPFSRRKSHPSPAGLRLEFQDRASSAFGSEQQPSRVWVLLDTDFRYRDMSTSFCEMLDLRRADLIGRTAEDITPADFVDFESVRDEIRRFGRKTGFWIYLRRDARYVLVRYSIRVRADHMADLYLEPLPMAS